MAGGPAAGRTHVGEVPRPAGGRRSRRLREATASRAGRRGAGRPRRALRHGQAQGPRGVAALPPLHPAARGGEGGVHPDVRRGSGGGTGRRRRLDEAWPHRVPRRHLLPDDRRDPHDGADGPTRADRRTPPPAVRLREDRAAAQLGRDAGAHRVGRGRRLVRHRAADPHGRRGELWRCRGGRAGPRRCETTPTPSSPTRSWCAT